jgi:hypothetical protein
VWDNARLVLNRSTIANNVVEGTGGGIYVKGEASVVVDGGSRVHGNTAPLGGGGVYVRGNASVAITNSSVYNNSAHSALTNSSGGGGLHVMGNGSVSLAGGSSVHRNTADLGGGICVAGDATVWVAGGTRVQGNTAWLSGGGMFVADKAIAVITGGSSVYNNTAGESGGGLYIQGNARVALEDNSSVRLNIAASFGGGLVVTSTASVVVTGSSSVSANRVWNGSGGGMTVWSGANVTIDSQSAVVNNTCSGGGGGGIAIDVYIPQFDTGGREAVVDVKKSPVSINNSTVSNNTSIRAAGGGVAVAGSGSVELVNGTVLSGNQAVNSSGGGVVLLNNGTLSADSSVMFASNFVRTGYVGSDIAAFGTSSLRLPNLRGQLTKCSAGVYLAQDTCQPDEVSQHDRCVCGCPQHMYSFVNATDAALCDPCPDHAKCLGGSLVVPVLGYWASAQTSVQMHRCPLSTTACNYTNVTHQCNVGYTGTLCGSCQLPDYGLLSPFRCGRCLPPKVQLVLFLLVSLAGVVFVTITVHATWQDNLSDTTAVLTTDLIKVLVQYLQYTVIIGSVSVPWPLFDFQRWFQVINVVFAVASSQVLSLDCWLYAYIPQGMLPIALQRQLVYFLAPVLVFVAVMALQWLVWAVVRWLVPLVWRPKEGTTPQPASVWRKLPVTMLVSAYYAYPTLVRVPLSFFACLRIDRLSPEVYLAPGATAPLNHTLGYWVSSPDLACSAGYHKGWAFGLGLPSILLWCVAVPVAMGVGLFLCRAKADEDSFREHFGFL